MKPDNLSDCEVLDRSIKEPWIFGVLVARYQEKFLRKARSVIHSDELAQDIVQDTFVKIYKNAGRFEDHPGASFSSWAYKILLNTCYSYYERDKRDREKVERVDFADLDMTPSPIYIEDDENDDGNGPRLRVEKILARMPKSLSKFLRLYFLEEKSQKEIAASEHMSPEAVRSRIHRAKKYFRTVILTTV